MRFHSYTLLFCFIFFIILTSCKEAEKENGLKMAEAREKNVKSLIHVGMDVDKAINILKEKGFRVGEKHMPTKKEDYYLVLIPLFDKDYKIPLRSTFAEVTGTESKINDKIYVFIEANLDNMITLIE